MMFFYNDSLFSIEKKQQIMENISEEFHKVAAEILRKILDCVWKDGIISQEEADLIENYSKLSKSYQTVLNRIVEDTGSKSLTQKTLSKAYAGLVESGKNQALEDGRISMDEAAILGILMNDLFNGITGLMENID